MEIKNTNKTELVFTLKDLEDILTEKLELSGGRVKLEKVTKTEAILGMDIHDCDYIEVFTGLKLIHEK